MNPLLIGGLIKAGTSIVGNLINKPKKQTAPTDYLDKYINRLKGDLARSDTYHTAMRGSMRNIGKQAGKMNRQIQYDQAQYGDLGGGITAQRRQSVQQETNRAINEASLKATQLQEKRNQAIRDRIAEAEMMKNRIIEQTQQQNEAAQQQWKQNFASDLVQTGGQIAGSLATQGMQSKQAMDQAYDKAKLAGFEGTREEFAKQAEQSGFTSPQNYATQLGQQTITPQELSNTFLELKNSGAYEGNFEQFKQDFQDFRTTPSQKITLQELKDTFAELKQSGAYEGGFNQFIQEYQNAVTPERTDPMSPTNLNAFTGKQMQPEVQPPKRGAIKTLYDEKGNQRQYQQVGDVATWMDTGKPIKPREWEKWNLKQPDEPSYRTPKQVYDKQGNEMFVRWNPKEGQYYNAQTNKPVDINQISYEDPTVSTDLQEKKNTLNSMGTIPQETIKTFKNPQAAQEAISDSRDLEKDINKYREAKSILDAAEGETLDLGTQTKVSSLFGVNITTTTRLKGKMDAILKKIREFDQEYGTTYWAKLNPDFKVLKQ